MAEDDTKAAPNPKLTAVLIPSIEFNCKIVFNWLVSKLQVIKLMVTLMRYFSLFRFEVFEWILHDYS